MRSPREIVSAYHERVNEHGPLHRVAREVRDTYLGDVAVPLTELDPNERRNTANLLQLGLDGTAQRIASTFPDTRCPPTQPGRDRSEKQARKRRQALLGMHEANKLPLRMGRRARHLIGYASSPVVIRPNFKMEMAEWSIRDPLGCYPAPTGELDHFEPPDAIFSYKRSLAWLLKNYPDATAQLYVGESGDRLPRTAQLEIVEYVDAEQLTLIVLGKSRNNDADSSVGWGYDHLGGNTGRDYGSNGIVVLERLPNRAECCTAIVPGRLTLDRPQGQFDSLVGLYYTQARLAALELIAIERGIFPEQWLVARQGDVPKVIEVADGREGILGIVQGGEMQTINVNPGYKTTEAVDRIERAQRLDGRIPAEMHGEATSNIRTGRRGDQVLSAAIDYGIQEAQRIFEVSLECENRRAVAVDKAYFGSKSKTFFVEWKGASGALTYTPNDLWDTDRNIVRYSQAGTDINGLVISMGQRIGLGTMSKRTGMELDPLVQDAETEYDRITVEAIDRAGLAAIEQQAVNGEFTPVDLARLKQLVKTDRMEWEEAVMKVQEEAQERQATPAPAGSPETMPGVAMPGMGAEQPPDVMAEPPDSLGRMTQLLGSLRLGQRTSPQENLSEAMATMG